MVYYPYLSKREYRKDRMKVLILGIIIGLSAGVVGGFLWAASIVNDLPIVILKSSRISF